MDPLNINLVAQSRSATRIHGSRVSLFVIIFLVIILGYNLFQIYSNQRIISLHNQRIRHAPTHAPAVNEAKGSGNVSQAMIQVQTDRIKRINRIILQDVFPWSMIMNRLENSTPQHVYLTSLNHSGDFQKINLEGQSDSLTDISLFISNLDHLDMFQKTNITNLTIARSDTDGGVSPKDSYQFQIEAVLNLNQAIEHPDGVDVVSAFIP